MCLTRLSLRCHCQTRGNRRRYDAILRTLPVHIGRGNCVEDRPIYCPGVVPGLNSSALTETLALKLKRFS